MRKTILLVDDDELVRITLKEFFTLLGLTVIEASNGREGIEKAINNEIHILIADYRMPDLTGVEMIKEIR
ncbi:response regulator, partial [Candidatus Kryptobacter tengchongensis]